MGKAPRQVAVVPVRHSREGVEICLIRRRDSQKWGIPKGYIDRGDTPEQAALTEAHEEAGLKGDIVRRAIGSYAYQKWEADLTVGVYVMHVRDVQTKWPEMSFRERRWVSPAEAAKLLAKHPVRRLLPKAIRHVTVSRGRRLKSVVSDCASGPA